MSRLLNALLDISKLESGAIQPEPTDFTVAAIFEELRMEFADIAANKGLRLKIEHWMDACTAIPRWWSRSSATSSRTRSSTRGKAGSACAACTRRLWFVSRCSTQASASPPISLPYIYDEFYQVGVPTNSSRDGYGLGLSIVQRLVKLLTLRLDVRSEVGKGSAFSLMLPASSAADHTGAS